MPEVRKFTPEEVQQIMQAFGMCRNHDWTFEFSDDHSKWKAGSASLAKLNAFCKDEVTLDIKDRWHASVFSGRPFNTELQQKPEITDYLDPADGHPHFMRDVELGWPRKTVSMCWACGCVEGKSMTSVCPLVPPTYEQRRKVESGQLDFTHRGWEQHDPLPAAGEVSE